MQNFSTSSIRKTYVKQGIQMVKYVFSAYFNEEKLNKNVGGFCMKVIERA